MGFYRNFENKFKHPFKKLYCAILNIINIKGRNNKVILIYNGKEKNIFFFSFILVNIKGDNNIIKLNYDDIYKIKNTRIIIDGNNNLVSFDSPFQRGVWNTIIKINGSNAKFIAGSFLHITGCKFELSGNTKIVLGKNCKMSEDINVWTTDSHYIYDENGKIINISKDIIIADNCWIAQGASILKGGCMGEWSVLGYKAILTKDFSKNTNCILVGAPARIVKEKITWKEIDW